MSLGEKPLWLSDLDNAFRRTQTSESTKLFYKRFPLGSIWQWNLENTLNPIIFSDSSATEKIQAIQQTELFAVNATDVESNKLSYAAWDKYLNSRFGNWKQKANGLQESHYREDLTFQVDGTLYSLDFLKKLNIVLEVLDRFPLDPNARFLEIGSGFGQIGRMLRHFRPGSQYIAIDLPESLYFASIYLNLTCPNARIVWADTPEAVAAVLSESNRADMVLIPCVFMDQLASSGITVDAFINTSSLGEMGNATSRFYLQILQNQLKTKHAFLLNRLLNSFDRHIEPDRAQENGWYFSLDDKWRVLHWELEPAFTRIPYAEMFHNREILWIASRSVEPVKHAVPKEIFKQSWYQGFSLRASVRHANQLVFDTGMESTLCHVCEAARTDKTEANLDALIKYLSVIRKPFPFEELPLLFSFYKEIANKKHFLQQRKLLTGWIFNLITILGLRRLGVAIARRLPVGIKDLLYKLFYNEQRSQQAFAQKSEKKWQ